MAKQSWKVPHTLVILFSMVVLAQILTYVIPAGSYERVETSGGRFQVVPGSFHLTPDTPALSPFASLTALPKGFSGAHEIIFFVFIIGGAFAVIRSTGALEAGIGTLLRRWSHRPFWLIAGGAVICAFGASTVGFGEEFFPFVPVLVALCLALGFDRLTAIAIVMVGYGIGFCAATINPFTVLIAQDIAQLEAASGLWYRILLFLILVPVGIHHVWSYARAVKREPSMSLVADVQTPDSATIPDLQAAEALVHLPPMTGTQTSVLAAFGLSMVLLVAGMTWWQWGLDEMQGLFAGLTLVVIAVARISPDRAATEFSLGAASLTSVALLIGVARAIQVVLQEGGVVDTLVHGISMPIKDLPPTISAVGMFVVQTVINFFIPSGSGQAFVTMPIMTPLADVIGVSRQVAVLAFQLGDGLSNILIPTNYVLIGILAMAGVPYDRWVRFIMPLLVKIAVLGSLALVVAVVIGYE
jgi:uncharacterized ion transporter superfamily protein YfcC